MIRITPAPCSKEMAMARLSRGRMEYDEDQLEREADDDPKDSLTTLYRGLRRRSESAAEAALALGQILERMTHSAIRNDTAGLTRWYGTCLEIIARIDKEGEE